MKQQILILVLSCLFLCLCACSSPAARQAEVTLPTLAAETATEPLSQPEDDLLGVWSNQNGLTLRFFLAEDGRYLYELHSENQTSALSAGAYQFRDGVLSIHGWSGQEETEISFSENALTLELKGSSFTLIRQEDANHAP